MPRFLLVTCLCLLIGAGARAELLLDEEPIETETGGGIEVPGPDGAVGMGDPLTERRDSTEILVFDNNDQLHGELRAITEGGAVTWQRGDVAVPLSFSPDNLLGLRLRRGFGSAVSPDASRVELTNGDTLFGEIVALDDEKLTLNTPYGGILNLRRNMIRTVFPGRSAEPALFSGPGRLEDWTVDGNKNWRIKGSRLIAASGRIGRDVKLPDVARLSMDVEWRGRYPTFMLSLYSTSPQNSTDCYNLSINNTTVYLNRNGAQTSNLGHHNIQEITKWDRMHMEVLINRPERSVYLMLNGKMVKHWKDPQEFTSNGTNMIIYSHDNNVTMSFANIRVSKWDGKFPNEATTDAEDNDMIEFANEDRVHGALKSIENGVCTFETKFAPKLDIPIERVTRIDFNKANEERVRRNRGDVELYFASGEHLTVDLRSLSDRDLTGWSEALGDVQLKSDAFVGLRFNLYKAVDDEDLQRERIAALQELIFH